MIIRKFALPLFLSAGLAACGASVDEGGIDRRASLEKIQDSLNATLTAEDGSYGKYLILLSSKSAELKTLAELPTETASADPELAARNLVVSISAGALLSDLPGSDESIRTAIRASVMSEGRLEEICASGESADCALGQTLLNTISSRQIATDALALSVSSKDPSELADLAILTYNTFASSLPETVPTFSMDETDAGATTHFITMRQQACTLSWAHSLLLPKMASDRVMEVNSVFRSAMAGTFDQTKVNLCVAGAASCTAAELQCARGEDTSASCMGKKTSALLSSCGPVESDLGDAVSSLIPDDQTGT